MISPHNINYLIPIDSPTVPEEIVDIDSYRVYSDEETLKKVCKILRYKYIATQENSDGFKETSLNVIKSVANLKDAIRKVPSAYGTNNGVKVYRTYYPCYVNTSDKSTLRFVLIIRPGTDMEKLQSVDMLYPSIPYTS
jgi:hypothetical protein